MIYQKKSVGVGNFASKGKGADIEHEDIITILDEGKTVDGTYGPQEVFLIQIANGEERNININQTSINKLVDAFGEDSVGWVGQKVKAWILQENVSGTFRQVLYLTHPDKDLADDDEPVQVAPKDDGAPMPTEENAPTVDSNMPI